MIKIHKATCPKCGAKTEYRDIDVREEQTKEQYKEYINCPNCSENIVVKVIDTTKPYIEGESAYHCLKCGGKLTMRYDRIDGYSWLVCKKCAGENK